jgi:hypothetical protein
MTSNKTMVGSSDLDENDACMTDEGFEIIRRSKPLAAVEAARAATAAAAVERDSEEGENGKKTSTKGTNDNKSSPTNSATSACLDLDRKPPATSSVNAVRQEAVPLLFHDGSAVRIGSPDTTTDDKRYGKKAADQPLKSSESVELEYVPILESANTADTSSLKFMEHVSLSSETKIRNNKTRQKEPRTNKIKSQFKTLIGIGKHSREEPIISTTPAEQETIDLSSLLSICERHVKSCGATWYQEKRYKDKLTLQSFETSMSSFEEAMVHDGTAADSNKSLWDGIRQWLKKHTSNADRHTAIVDYRNSHGATPLHIICRYGKPPSDILHMFLQAAPDACSIKDNLHWLPLHYACASKGPSDKVIAKLVSIYPEATISKDLKGKTPIHYALASSLSKQVQQKDDKKTTQEHNLIFIDEEYFEVDTSSEPTVELTPEMIRLLVSNGASTYPDERGMLPCHYACRYLSLAPDALKVLIDANPHALLALDDAGRPPLHFLMENADKPNAVMAMALLIEYDRGMTESFINIMDNSGRLPVHCIVMQSLSLRKAMKVARTPKETAQVREREESLKQCLNLYLDAEPDAGAIFLTTVQAMPSWLIDSAITNSYLQNVLNEMITKRFPTAILLIDLYLLILMIVVFWVASSRCISSRDDCGYNQKNLLVILYSGATYYLFRELSQALSMQALGLFQRWSSDTKNWLVVVTFFLVYADTAVMQFGLLEDSMWFQTLVSLTLAMLCLCFLSFLKFILVGLAVFVHGLVFVLKKLWAFLVCLGVIIVAFSLMFVNLFRGTEYCPPSFNDTCEDFPFCSFMDASLTCIQMLVGQLIPNECFPTRLSIIFFVMYIFGACLLLVNVLIAIVIDSYSLIHNERSTMVFWSSRLDFVGELCAMVALFTPRRPNSNQQRFHGYRRAITADMQVWDQMLALYENQELNWRSSESITFLLIRILCAVVVIPCWILAGVVTAGVLWPQQIREYLLLQKTAIEVLKLEDGHHGFFELSDLKENLRVFKKEARSQMQSHREAIISFCEEADDFQKVSLADLAQVREVMQSMLEIRRSTQKKGRRRRGFQI